MSEALSHFRSLIERVRQKCPHAAKELHDLYSPHLRRVVRRQLSRRLRPQFDSIDFLQQVWKSFFAGDLGEHDFDTPEALIAFLQAVACNKVADEGRNFSTRKRDTNRLEFKMGPAEIPANNPSPSQEFSAGERLKTLLHGQPPHVRRILEMLQEGHTYEAIAAEVRMSTKFIQRILQRIQERHGSS